MLATDLDSVPSCDVCGRIVVSGANRCPACADDPAFRPPLGYV